MQVIENTLDIKYCIGCNVCQKNEENQCVLKDDMNKIYDAISKCDYIIIMSPIYMNQITGILKNVLDRFNPYCASENLKGKKIYLITVGQMSEEEQQEICNSIDKIGLRVYQSSYILILNIFIISQVEIY